MMKAKNQPPLTSEIDAKEKLIVYVYEYLTHAGAKRAATSFLEDIQYDKEIQFSQPEGPGFLANWWCVFWDLYCAAPEKRNQVEPTNEARAFHEYNMRTVMSPSCAQTSPPQPGPPFVGAGAGGMMGPGGARYGPHSGGPLRGGPPGGPRMQPMSQAGPAPPPPQMGGPQFISGPSYAGPPPRGPPPRMQGPPPPPQQHINQGPMGFGPSQDQVGSSPGLNRMTPVGGPPPPPNGPPGQMVGMPGQGGPSQVNTMTPRDGAQGGGGWQGGNVNYNVNSPANQPMYAAPGSNQPAQGGGPIMMNDSGPMEVKSSPGISGGTGEASTPHPEEYVMPVSFGQESGDQCESAEIFKIQKSMQDDTAKMFEKEQSEQQFNLDYSDTQNKWS